MSFVAQPMEMLVVPQAEPAESLFKQLLVCVLIVTVFLLDFARIQFGLPKALALAPELLTGAALLVFLEGFARQRLRVPPGYLLLLLILLLSITAGLVIADATIGPLVGGLRAYGKYLPFFLLPLVCRFSERQLRVQFGLVLALTLIQFPITFLQRFVIYAGGSGDLARGTFSSGSQNAIVLLCTLAVVVAAYHRGALRVPLALTVGLALCLPPTMAEVKGAFLLLPIALLLPTLFAPEPPLVPEASNTRLQPTRRGGNTRRVLGMLAVGAVALTLFAVIYQMTESSTYSYKRGDKQRTSIVEFITDPRLLMAYLAPQLGDNENIEREGRLDGVIEPFVELADQPLRLVSGLGLGALTTSPFDALSADQHRHILETGRLRVTFALLIWEIGILGTTLVLFGLYMVWRDAKVARHHPSILGMLATGWLAAVPIFVLAMFWKNTMVNNAVMYLFAYFSGHVVSLAQQMRVERLSVAPMPSVHTPVNDLPAILNEPLAERVPG